MAKDGGSAFPQIVTESERLGGDGEIYANTYSYGGMSLRDYRVKPYLWRRIDVMRDVEGARGGTAWRVAS